MAKLTKSKVVKYLKDKGAYEDIDDMLIEELLYNITLAKMAKDDLDDRGLMVAINAAGTLMNLNPSNNAYHSALKQIMTIGRKLGLDFRSRTELKLGDIELDDEFDD